MSEKHLREDFLLKPQGHLLSAGHKLLPAIAADSELPR